MAKTFVWESDGRKWVKFYCPACQMLHAVTFGQSGGWEFNENLDFPTIVGSILVHHGGIIPRCHSNVDQGFIVYSSDCSHGLAGHTLELEDLDIVKLTHPNF